MPLDKQVKSVLFHDGVSDGTDRFLLEPPSVDYAENLRIDKDGSLQKRPGFGPSALTTVSTPVGDPFLLHSVGDTLFALTDDGARSYDGTYWSTVFSDGFIGTQTIAAETQSLTGLADPQHAYEVDGNGALTKRFVAYEVREATSQNAGGTPDTLDRHVICAEFDASGKLVTQRRYENAHSPQMVTIPGAVIQSFLLYADGTTGALRLRAADGAAVSFDWFIAPDTTQGFPINHSTSPRLGQGTDVQSRYFAKWCVEAGVWVIIGQYSKAVVVHSFDAAGVFIDSAEVDPGLWPGWKSPLAADVLEIPGVGSMVYVLWHVWDVDGGTGAWRISVAHFLVGPSSVTYADESYIVAGTADPDTSENGPGVVNGTIKTNGQVPVKWFIGLTTAGYSSYSENINAPDQGAGASFSQTYKNRSELAGVRWFVWNPSTDSADQEDYINGHRIASSAALKDGEFYVAIQQWADYTPHVINPAAVHDFVAVGAAIKPVTTVLCRLGQDGEPWKPIAALDPGMGQVCDYVESEFRTHLLPLDVVDGNLLTTNRVVLSAASINYWQNENFNNKWQRDSNAGLWSTALARMYSVGIGSTDRARIHSANFGDGLAISTAVSMWFDGSTFAEFGPLDSPEIMRVQDNGFETSNPDEEIPDQGYDQHPHVAGDPVNDVDWRKLNVVCGYTDAKGNKHRSAPSTTTYALAPSSGTVYVTPPLSIQSSTKEYWYELYVSKTVDDDVQLTAAVTEQVRGGGDVPTVELSYSFGESVMSTSGYVTDYPVRTGMPLYTAGGVLAADPWPAFGQSVVTSTRFWAIDAVNRGRVIYSKLFEDYIAPEYNPTLSINLGDERDLTAIGKLDDKVVVFEPNDIHVIYGEGPDNKGEGQDFAVHYISTDVGCSDQESVVETPIGLLFYSSPRGFYLLDRNLQIQFIGKGVEDIALGINIIAATLDPRKAEVRFLVETDPNATQNDPAGPDPDTTAVARPPRPSFGNTLPNDACLSFNYEKGSWLLYNNYEGAAATIYQRKYTRLLSDWSVWQESETRWDDPTGDNRTKMVTPWIKLSEQVQGFQRLWRITFLGRYLSSLQDLGGNVYEAGDIIVRLYFDYEATASQEKRFRMQDFGFNPFNATPLRADRLQFEMSPVRGRCQSVQIEIEEVNSEDQGEGLTYALGRGFEIVSADFSIGVSPQRALLPAAVK